MHGFAHQENARSYMHRRASVNVGNPAIVLHQSYTKPAGENDLSWLLAIEAFAAHVGEHLKSLGRGASDGPTLLSDVGDEEESARRYEHRSYDHRHYRQGIGAGSVKLTSLIDIFDEFWTYKLIIDFSRTGEGERVPELFRQMLECLNELEAMIDARYSKAAGEGSSSPKATTKEIRKICVRISDEIAKVEPQITPAKPVAHAKVVCNAADDLFADFIGFSLACPCEPAPGQIPLELDGAEQRPLPRREESNVPDNIRPDAQIPKDNGGLSRLVDAVWPIAVELNPYRLTRAVEDVEAALDTPAREFTISRLNRGRALFVTSLGAVPSSPDQGISFPLAYLLLCPHRATWQIGRMIDRIHALGVFRLASLLEHDAIDRANDTMRRLIDDLEESPEASSRVRSELGDLNRAFESGLHYRIEWSRYYLNIYESLLRGTKFERVEGYQTYEEFVRRRIGAYFAAIESTSRRFVYLSRLLTERAGQRTSELSKRLLEGAELVSALPVTYYSYYVFPIWNNHLVAEFGEILPWTVDTTWMTFTVIYTLIVARNVRPLMGPWFRRQFERIKGSPQPPADAS
jgi:hypothetical protein